MAPTDHTESELRQQLREAWQQIAELQWRLQSEQRNDQSQARLIDSGAAAMRQSRTQHSDDIEERDQEIADLEDSRYPQATPWSEPASGIGLRIIAELLGNAAGMPDSDGAKADLREWERRARIALTLEEEADASGDPAIALRSALNDVLRVDLAEPVSRRQCILVALLTDEWKTQLRDSGIDPHKERATISAASGEIQIRLPHLRSLKRLDPFLAALNARTFRDGEGMTLITVQSEPIP